MLFLYLNTFVIADMISRKIASIFLIAAIAATFSITIALSLLVPFPSAQQQEAMAQQQQNGTTTTTQSTTATPPASTNRAFNIYSMEVPGSSDTYIYSLPVIVVHRGDTVTVSLHNIAETGGGGGTTDTSERGTRDTSERGGSTDTSEQGGTRDTSEGGGTTGSTDTSEGGGGGRLTEGGGSTDTSEGGGTQMTASTEGRHSFTITTPPYSVNIDTAAGETRNATFTADQQGIFHYFCKYHPETMTGELVVLPPSSSSSTTGATASRPAT
jgi:plastocyanin